MLRAASHQTDVTPPIRRHTAVAGVTWNKRCDVVPGRRDWAGGKATGRLATGPVQALLAWCGTIGTMAKQRTPVLKVTKLSKAYGAHPIVSDFNLEVWPGDAIALTGRNGAGKSTILRCIIGADKADSGTIEICGNRLRESDPAVRRDLATVIDDLDFFPDLSVVEHLDLLARAHGLPDAEEAVDDVLHEVQLVAQSGQLPGTLSSGQRRRLALATAFVRPRKLLILDVEPLLGLVEDEQLARPHEGSGQGEATALAAGQGAGQLTGLGHELYLVQHIVDRPLRVGQAVGAGEQVEVLNDRQVGEEVEVVDDGGEVATYGWVRLPQPVPADLDRAAVGLVRADDAAQDRRLAGTVAARQRDRVTLPDLEVEVGDDRVRPVRLRELRHLEHRSALLRHGPDCSASSQQCLYGPSCEAARRLPAGPIASPGHHVTPPTSGVTSNRRCDVGLLGGSSKHGGRSRHAGLRRVRP